MSKNINGHPARHHLDVFLRFSAPPGGEQICTEPSRLAETKAKNLRAQITTRQ